MNTKTIWTNKYFAATMAVIACILWGSAFPVLKVTYAQLNLAGSDIHSRVLLAGGRFFIASLLTFMLLKFGMKQGLRINSKTVWPLILLGLFQTGLQYFFFYNGLANVSGIKSAILSSIGNFFVVLFAHFLYKNDRLNIAKLIGLFTGFLGIILINRTPGAAFTWDFTFTGEGFLLLSGLTSTIGTFSAKKLAKDLNPVLVNAYQLLFGSLLLLVVGLPGVMQRVITPTPLFWGLFIYSAFLSAAAFSIWYNLLKYNKAGEITIYRFIIPISGALLSAAFLPHETLTSGVVVALGLVAIGIGTVNYWGRYKPLRETKL